jgi:hypothetical protein
MRTECRLILAIILVSILLFSAMPRETSAIPFKIQGYLRDTNGMPITLANISLTGRYYNNSAQGYQTATSYVITNSEGYFKQYIAANEPGGYASGSEMTVSYKAGNDIVTTIVVIDGLGAWANLTYESKGSIVDAISSPLGVITVIVIVSVILVVFYIISSSGGNETVPDLEEKRPKRVERRRRQR